MEYLYVASRGSVSSLKLLVEAPERLTIQMADEKLQKTFYAPILKGPGNRVEVILSDTSLDRDEEFIGKKFLERAVYSNHLPALVDHENKALGLVAEWVNKRIVEKNVDGETHFALVAEPKWFLSNPTAQIIKDMIEKDGAKMGVSITAIPFPDDIKQVEKNGTKHTCFGDGEMLSADFVGIQSNRSAVAALARAAKIAKSFSFNNKTEVSTMDAKTNSELQKSVSEAVKIGFEQVTEDFVKASEISALNKLIEKLSSRLEKLEKADGEDEGEGEGEGEADKKEASKKPDLKKATQERQKKRDELNALNKTPGANDGQTSDANVDEDYSVGGFIKAYHKKPVQTK